jgi:hypothetical protein
MHGGAHLRSRELAKVRGQQLAHAALRLRRLHGMRQAVMALFLARTLIQCGALRGACSDACAGQYTCACARTAANCEACCAENAPKGLLPCPKAAAAAAADGG